MNILEIVINKYYLNRKAIFLIFVLLALAIIIKGLHFNKKSKRYFAIKLFQIFFSVIFIICLGKMAYLFGVRLEMENENFNLIFFFVITGFILVYGIFQSIIYKQVKTPLLIFCKNIKYVLYFELFLLLITNRLEVIEGIVEILAIVCTEIIIEALKKLKNNEKNKIVKESDYPNPDLYKTRQEQLKYFIPILEQQKSEPYAVMISGEWGMGKSSFMLALERQFSSDFFIWIQAGSEKSVSEIMSTMAEKIIAVLKRNFILIEREELIEKYFLAFSELFDEKGLGVFSKIKGVLEQYKDENAEEYLNEKLKDLKSTIFLVIDDLDRCDEEYQLKMFKVIRESTNLLNCKTIFLVDKNKFLKDKYKQNNIEKYVNFTLDLCRVDYQEIVSYLIDNLYDNFLDDIDNILKKDRNAEQIKKLVLMFPDEIIKSCNKRINEIIGSNFKNSEDEQKERIEAIRDTIKNIQINTTNSRKVKNFLKGIKRDIITLNKGIKNCGEEYKKEDWLRAIIEVQFLKNIFPDLYASIRMYNSLTDFWKNLKSDSVQILLGLKNSIRSLEEKKITVLNYIIYKIDIIDFNQVKIESEKFLSELHSDKATINNIIKYLEYAKSYEDFSVILNICMDQKFNNKKDRETFISKILSALSLNEMKNEEFLNFSENLLNYFNCLTLSENEKNICKFKGEKIISKIIVVNTYLLRNMLFPFLEIRKVLDQWDVISILSIDDLYNKLKILDSNSNYLRLKNDNNILFSIKQYYENLLKELQKEEYRDIGWNLEEISNEISIFFDICKFWQNIEYNLNSSDSEDELVNRYFYLNGVYSYKEIVFISVNTLKSALNILNSFYLSKEENYESCFSQILWRVLQNVVLKYESDPKWFEGREIEISYLLKKIAKKVYMLEDLQEVKAKGVITEIRLYLYKFSRYCENREA